MDETVRSFMLNLWYKNAVLYCLDVKTYMDANGDGVGDFEGYGYRWFRVGSQHL